MYEIREGREEDRDSVVELLTMHACMPSILQELGIIPGSPETARTLEAIFPADFFLSYPRF